MLGDLLASCFDVNLALWAGAASEVEDQAVRWVERVHRLPRGGGRIHERRHDLERHGARRRTRAGASRLATTAAWPAAPARSTARARRTTPSSARRSSSGSAPTCVRALPLDDRAPGCDPRRSRTAIDRDVAAGVAPIAVVATAGTTLTGAVDPIDALADVCAERGTSGSTSTGPTASPRRRRPSAGHLFAGLERADSVTLDAHKWLFLPKACGVVLVRRREDLHGALAHEEDYVPHDRPDHHMVDITLEYSRPFRALKLWLAFRAHGADAIRDAIERNLRQARLLHDEVAACDDFELLCGEPPLSVVPFRHVPEGVTDLDEHNLRLVAALQETGDVWVAPAQVDGRRLPAAVRRELPHDRRRRARARHACARRGADAGRDPFLAPLPSASSSRSCRSCGRTCRDAAETCFVLTGMPAPPCSSLRRSWRFVASGIWFSSPTAAMYARRSLGVRRFSIRCACSGVFGSPNAWIFFIAPASSGFCRSRAAIDAFWNHRLKSGTFERNVTTGRR